MPISFHSHWYLIPGLGEQKCNCTSICWLRLKLVIKTTFSWLVLAYWMNVLYLWFMSFKVERNGLSICSYWDHPFFHAFCRKQDQECLYVAKEFESLGFGFCYKEANGVADKLASDGQCSFVVYREQPLFFCIRIVWVLVSLDSLAIMYCAHIVILYNSVLHWLKKKVL